MLTFVPVVLDPMYHGYFQMYQWYIRWKHLGTVSDDTIHTFKFSNGAHCGYYIEDLVCHTKVFQYVDIAHVLLKKMYQ